MTEKKKKKMAINFKLSLCILKTRTIVSCSLLLIQKFNLKMHFTFIIANVKANTLAFKEPQRCLFLVTQNDLCAFNRNKIPTNLKLSLSLYFANFFSKSSILSTAFGVLVSALENREPGKTFSFGIAYRIHMENWSWHHIRWNIEHRTSSLLKSDKYFENNLSNASFANECSSCN